MKKFDTRILPSICVLITILVAGILLWADSQVAIQSQKPIYPKVIFQGEYKIGDGDWEEYRSGIHLSANKADITLKGTLNKQLPATGEFLGKVEKEDVVALYCDHLEVKVCENGCDPVILETELLEYEITCAKLWEAYRYRGEEEQEIEIWIRSPHKFGNENAVDEMLNNMYIYAGYDFEEDRMKEGSLQRALGMMILLSSCCMLGISIFAGRIHIRGNHIFLIISFLMLFAGGYVMLSSPNINLWNPAYTFNTIALGICMMLYQYLASLLVTQILGTKTQKYVMAMVHLSGVVPIILGFVSLLPGIHFYGTWKLWMIMESLVSLTLLVCVWYDTKETGYHKRMVQVTATVPMLGFLLDALATMTGWWQGGKICIWVFFIYMLAAFIVVVRIVPQKINDAARAKELEETQRELQQELKDRRVSVMMSQIRTHFIFNVMTIISGLCNTDPGKADDALILFARYLRKNMAIMDRDEPIIFSQELQHLDDYISLEKMRFGDKIKFEKKLEITDFKIPPLTIQPLVENAIKHGLLIPGKKGTVVLKSKKEEEGIRILIEDDGIGFSPDALEKEEAVGIRNVRYRVENMVGGSLEVVSIPGKGTKAIIKIPK